MILLTYKNKVPSLTAMTAPSTIQPTFTVASFSDDNIESARAAAMQAARYGHTAVLLSQVIETYRLEPNVVVDVP